MSGRVSRNQESTCVCITTSSARTHSSLSFCSFRRDSSCLPGGHAERPHRAGPLREGRTTGPPAEVIISSSSAQRSLVSFARPWTRPSWAWPWAVSGGFRRGGVVWSGCAWFRGHRAGFVRLYCLAGRTVTSCLLGGNDFQASVSRPHCRRNHIPRQGIHVL